MHSHRPAVAALSAALVIGAWALAARGQQVPAQSPLPGAPLGIRGEAIYPALEGWGPHKDGQTVIMIGYSNRNTDQTLDIPIGPNNRIEPGGPDYGQPTRFEPGRHYGVFAIAVPKDFGSRKLTWTLVANGHTATVQLSLNPPYWVDFFKNPASGNTPPVIRFAFGGAESVGPPRGIAHTLTATVGQPVPLRLWASDKPSTYDPYEGLGGRAAGGRGANAPGRGADAAAARRDAGRGDPDPGAQNFDLTAAAGRTGGARRGRGGGPQADVTVVWKVHRGPGAVTIADPAIRLNNKGDINAVMEASTTATFSEPGEYILRAQINDATGDGGGGDLCCWTNAHVRVTVK